VPISNFQALPTARRKSCYKLLFLNEKNKKQRLRDHLEERVPVFATSGATDTAEKKLLQAHDYKREK